MDKLLDSQLDEQTFIKSLEETVGQLETVAAAGGELAPNIDHIYMVSCGAGFWIIQGLQWWANQITKKMELWTFTSAKFISLDLLKLDRATMLVILSSKSGETRKMVNAAQLANNKACKIAVFTQSAQSPLTTVRGNKFFTGHTSQLFHSTFMLMQTFLGGIWVENKEWCLLPKLLLSLWMFPNALVSNAQQSNSRREELALRYKQGDEIYLISSGPGKLIQYAFGLCVLEEKLKLPIHPINADHFFHSTLEIVTKNLGQFILIVDEDASQEQMARVVEFCKTYGGEVHIYNTTDYLMEGIDKKIQPMIAPYIAEGALKRYALSLFSKVGMSLTELKYMEKVDY